MKVKHCSKSLVIVILSSLLIYFEAYGQHTLKEIVKKTNKKTYLTFEDAVLHRATTLLQPNTTSSGPSLNNGSKRTFIESRWNGSLFYNVKDSLLALEVVPSLLIRQQEQHSFPIDFPSYTIDGKVYYAPYSCQTKSQKATRYFSIEGQHFSNGQKGDFYIQDSLGRDIVNLESGSFGTNSLKIAYHQNRINGSKELFNSHGFRYNFPAKWSKEQNSLYNNFRLENNFQLILSRQKVKHQVSLDLDLLLEGITLGKVIDVETYNLNLEYFLQPNFLKKINLGFFARVYVGQDYYNIYFVQRLKAIRLGIALSN